MNTAQSNDHAAGSFEEQSDFALALVVEDIGERIERGDPVDRDEYLRRHPGYADRLCLLWPALLAAGEIRLTAPSAGQSWSRSQSEPNDQGDVVAAQLGDFQIVRKIGCGGMGIVYEAIQLSLNRRVALKVLTASSTMDSRQLKRFQLEAKAAACLNHPHIVPVHAVGCDQGSHYFAMQLIEGPTLAQVIGELRRSRGAAGCGPADEKTRSTHPSNSSGLAATRGDRSRGAAELALQAAEALEYAHRHGTVHRDVKPSNLLLDGHGKLWVADFGLAQVGGGGDLTRTGELAGTLRYMSPEQAMGKRDVIDQRTDVYSLGVTLYELLTLHPAFEGDDRAEVIWRIVQEEPKPLRRLNPSVPRDLETIVHKAMSKAQAARYATAALMAADLRRFLTGEPIRARPPSTATRLRFWASRHKTLTVSATVAALAAAAIIVIVTWYGAWQREASARVEAAQEAASDRSRQLERNERYLARSAFVLRLRQATELLRSSQVSLARQSVREIEADAAGFDPEEFAWHYVRNRVKRAIVPVSTEGWNLVVPSPDGRRFVAVEPGRGLLTGRIHVLDRVDLRLRTSITVPGVLASSGPSFAPDGRLICQSGTGPAPDRSGMVWAWDVETGRLRTELRFDAGPMTVSATMLAGNRLLIETAPKNGLWTSRLWELRPDSLEPRLVTTLLHKELGYLFPSPDGRMLAKLVHLQPTGSEFAIVDVLTGSVRDIPGASPVKEARVNQLAVSRDGKILIGQVNDFRGIQFWDLASGRSLARHDVGRAVYWSHFKASPDGAKVAICDKELGTVTFWDRRGRTHTIGSGQDTGDFEGRVFSPDGSRFAFHSITSKGAVWLVWDVKTGNKLATCPQAVKETYQSTFTPDGRELVINGSPNSLLWRIDPLEPTKLPGHTDEAWSVAFSPDGGLLASGSDDSDDKQTIKLWDPVNENLVRGWFGGEGTVTSLAFSRDGKILASAHLANSDNVRLWDVATGQLIDTLSGHTQQARSVAFSSDGALLASCDGSISANDDGTVRLWDVNQRSCVGVLEGRAKGLMSLAFSPDGGVIAAAGDTTVRLWRVATREEIKPLTGRPFNKVAFSSDRNTLATLGQDGKITFWNLRSGEERTITRAVENELGQIVFSPDGAILAAGENSGSIRLWDALTGQELLVLEGHNARVHGLAFSPEGSTLASCSHDGAVKLWRSRP